MTSQQLSIRGSALIVFASLIALNVLFSCNKTISLEGCRYDKEKIEQGGTAYVHSLKCKNHKK